MRYKKAYIPSPAPVRYTPRAVKPYGKFQPLGSPVTQTKPMSRRTGSRRRIATRVLGPLIGYGVRRLFRRINRRGYPSADIKTAGNGATNSYFKHTQKFHPKASSIKRTGNAQRYHVTVSDRIENITYGQQAVKTLDSALFSDLNTMANAIPTIAGTATLTKSALLHDIRTEITFSNMSEATAYLDLYEIIPRSILPSSACAPDTLFENGVIDQGAALGKEVLGVKPTVSNALTSFHRILKHYRIELAQGQSHVHKQTYNLGFKWNYELVNVLGASNVHPRCSRYLMCIVQGSPCNSATTVTNVTTTPTAIDVVRRYTYTWYYNTPATTNIIYNNALPTVTDGRILDIGSGEPDIVNAA